MHDRIHANRLILSPRARLLAIATLVSGVLLAGCGGSSSSTTADTASAASSVASRATSTGSAEPGALAFSNCMRASGVPNFPDPSPGGGFHVNSQQGVNPSSPAFRAAQAKCGRLLPDDSLPGLGSTTHPGEQTLAKLLRIARCMRQHGISQFPDPTTQVPAHPTGIAEITDFDGAILLFPSTINLQAPAYRQALTACGAPPLGLPH